MIAALLAQAPTDTLPGEPPVWLTWILAVAGAFALWGLVEVLRRLRPPADALPLGPKRPYMLNTVLRGGPDARPLVPDDDKPADMAEWGVLEFAFGFAIMFFLVSAFARVLGAGEEAGPIPAIQAQSLANVAMMLGLGVFIWFVHEQNAMRWLFARGSWKRQWLIIPSLFVLGLPVIAWVVAPAWQALLDVIGQDAPKQQLVQMLRDSDDPALWMWMIITAAVVAPIVEEFLYRGVLYVGMRKLIGRWGGAVGSGVVFGLIHANLYAFLPLTVLGVILAWSFERTRNLAVPIAFHMLFNVLTLVTVALGAEPT